MVLFATVSSTAIIARQQQQSIDSKPDGDDDVLTVAQRQAMTLAKIMRRFHMVLMIIIFCATCVWSISSFASMGTFLTCANNFPCLHQHLLRFIF